MKASLLLLLPFDLLGLCCFLLLLALGLNRRSGGRHQPIGLYLFERLPQGLDQTLRVCLKAITGKSNGISPGKRLQTFG